MWTFTICCFEQWNRQLPILITSIIKSSLARDYLCWIKTRKSNSQLLWVAIRRQKEKNGRNKSKRRRLYAFVSWRRQLSCHLCWCRRKNKKKNTESISIHMRFLNVLSFSWAQVEDTKKIRRKLEAKSGLINLLRYCK